MHDTVRDGRAARPAQALATGLRIVTIAGPDAASFLDSQSTTALAARAEGKVGPSAFADAHGRVLMVGAAWRFGDEWRLAVPADEAEWFSRHLSRYRFRARLEIAVRDEVVVAGFTDPLPRGVPAPPAGMAARDQGLETAALDVGRHLVAALDGAAELPFPAPAADAAESEAWKRARLRAGEAQIRESTRGTYLPQMLALDALGAVSFDKGCYPGQEVIARTRNFGRVKRRAVLLQWPEALPEGTVEIAGVKVDVLDCAPDAGEGFLVQAVAPDPLPDELALRVRPGQAPSSRAS